ncbi:MAG TPA: chromosome segregation protein SMC [Pyrinomonadaceae bacterium]|jgi:chromosome segregation protein
MFKLQRLEITGFKSFADYTEIVFTGNGITAVVGPNGCGKSNVSDSISWVLGEQRAKSLRGEEMKDVVFQGTSKRAPSGMAEVVLHLVRDEENFFADEESDLSDIDASLTDLDENAVDLDEIEAQEAAGGQSSAIGEDSNGFHSEEIEVEKVQAAQAGSVQVVEKKIKTRRHWRPRAFALDFAPGEAISVTRRLYLSGESEYQLNGKTCRLRDIQDLFAGTGLSGAHYALIEQGRIGQILSAKPSDRRNLIEEAAGISKFRTRQRAAEARLETAKTNLGRIFDIVSEIEKQANALRRQAAKTRRYKILREEFRVLLRQVFTAEGKYLSELVAELEQNLTGAVKAERDIFAQVTEKDEAFRTATHEARESEENLSAMRQKHSENALERDRASREHRYQNEQIAGLNNRSASLKSEIEAIEQRLKLVNSELQRLDKDERKERGAAEQVELGLREAEKKYQIKLFELNQIEAGQEAERAEVLQHTAAVERLTEIERQLENTIERLKERAEGLRREGVRAEETRAEHQEESKMLAKNLESEREKLSGFQAEKAKLLEEAGKARVSVQIAETALKTLREEFARARHRLETLRELEEKRAVYAPSIQKLFADETKIGVKFLGTLADRFSVEEKAEKAVENLFGAFLQTILVETEKDAQKTIEYLNKNNVGRISVLVVSSQQSAVSSQQKSKIKNQKPRITDFLGVSEDFAVALEEVFPREMAARLVEGFDGVKVKSDESLVNFDGDFVFGGKLFVGGKANSNEKNSSLLAFKRELRELEKQSEKLAKETEKSENEAEKARVNLTEKEEKIVDLQSLIVRIERELVGLEVQEKSIAQEIERAERHRKVVSEEVKQIETEISETQIRQKEAHANAQKAEKLRDEATAKLEKISQNLVEARAGLEKENAVLNEKRTLAATSSERRRSAQSALRRVELEEKELRERLARQDFEILEIKGKIKDLTASSGQIEQRITLAENEQASEQNELAAATEHLKLKRETADAMSSELAELNKAAAEARNERATLEIRQAETVTRLKNLNEKCSQDLGVSLVELVEREEVEVEDGFDLEEASERVRDLREKLENFGAINMLALEELSEIEERLLFLTSQRQDIIDSIEAAEAALREIKERSREKFRAAFEAINRNFTEFFQELFGGGHGLMTLLEADDVLEAGIEIVAQPPGKRLQNILLLSGGEKAMTAIALVMAIFKYRPAPFCLLDEVDAPLDDANVGRFVNKIAEMSEKTQFIVITHNKRTMEAARALYGVTMQEAGVSKVVSVRFE